MTDRQVIQLGSGTEEEVLPRLSSGGNRANPTLVGQMKAIYTQPHEVRNEVKVPSI